MARSKEALERVVGEFQGREGRAEGLREAEAYEGDSWDGESEEDSGDECQAEDDEGKTTGQKRKAVTEPKTKGANKKLKGDVESTGPPFRVYLQWRGRETAEGEIELDYDNSNVGHIDFLDSACTRFRGKMNISFAGDPVSFSGYKISDKGRWGPLRWDLYSEEQHERERVARWR